MNWEDPDKLLQMELVREEYCQRMLTSLILGGPYPKWNTRSEPSDNGFAFLNNLHKLAFGSNIEKPLQFIDEFKLDGISNGGISNGYPDYGILWENHLWIIELKTDSSSHRKSQLPHYLKLARYNYPNHSIEILYLTPEMERKDIDGSGKHSLSHLFWPDVTSLINQIWLKSIHLPERVLESALQRELSNLSTSHSVFNDNANIMRQAINLSIQVQESGRQMAVEVNAGGLDEINELRIRIRDALKRLDTANNVKPWIWFEKSSGGKALTKLGCEVGCELRLSRYK
jgi:hypothetical protein